MYSIEYKEQNYEKITVGLLLEFESAYVISVASFDKYRTMIYTKKKGTMQTIPRVKYFAPKIKNLIKFAEFALI